MLRALLTGVSVVVVAGCTSHSPAPVEAEPTPTLGSVQTRNHTISIEAGTTGLVYTISTRDGVEIAAQLTGTEFARQFPALHDSYQTGMAKLDARLMLRPHIRAGGGESAHPLGH